MKVEIPTNHNGTINTANFNFNGIKFATGGNDGIINLFSSEKIFTQGQNIEPEIKLIKNGHSKLVLSLSFSHPIYGTYLASCGQDKKLIIWKEKSENNYENIYEYKHENSVTCCKFAPYNYGLIVLCGTEKGEIIIHELQKNYQKWNVQILKNIHKDGINSIDWAPASQPINIFFDEEENSKEENKDILDDNDNDDILQPMKFITCGNDNKVNIFMSQRNTINSFIKINEFDTEDIPKDVAFLNFVGYTQLTFACGLKNGKCLIYKCINNEWKKTYEINVGGNISKLNWSLCGTYLGISSKKNEKDNEIKFYRENLDETWIEVN
jgi:protein transport protein SEC13